MNNDFNLIKLPDFVKSISGDLDPNYWTPKNLQEWTDVHKTATFLNIWNVQQHQERHLRKMISIWVFIIISFQIVCIFILIALDAYKILQLNVVVMKILFPSILTEVIGMGFIVVKYLFKTSKIIPPEIPK